MKTDVLKNFAKFTGKNQRRGFSVNFAKFLRAYFLRNTSGGCFLMMDCFLQKSLTAKSTVTLGIGCTDRFTNFASSCCVAEVTFYIMAIESCFLLIINAPFPSLMNLLII